MNPIEAISASVINRLKAAQATRIAANAAASPVKAEEGQTPAPVKTAQAPLAAAPTRVLAGSEAPVDTDRVALIRKAVEQGNYPIKPARIADAMIAAGYLLRAPK